MRQCSILELTIISHSVMATEDPPDATMVDEERTEHHHSRGGGDHGDSGNYSAQCSHKQDPRPVVARL